MRKANDGCYFLTVILIIYYAVLNINAKSNGALFILILLCIGGRIFYFNLRPEMNFLNKDKKKMNALLSVDWYVHIFIFLSHEPHVFNAAPTRGMDFLCLILDSGIPIKVQCQNVNETSCLVYSLCVCVCVCEQNISKLNYLTNQLLFGVSKIKII